MALFKVTVKKDFKQDQFVLLKEAIFHLNCRCETVEIFEKIYLRSVLENKFGIQFDDQDFSFGEMLEIEHLSSKVLANLKLELGLIMTQKQEAAQNKQFERLASLRDYEKEIEVLIAQIDKEF